MRWAETPPRTAFTSHPSRTFMALKSLSAKYSGVLRIHFTEKKGEGVSGGGWGALPVSTAQGATKSKPRKNLAPDNLQPQSTPDLPTCTATPGGKELRRQASCKVAHALQRPTV